jgi:hypothetical protein
MWNLNGTIEESHPGFSSSIVESAAISATVLSPVTEAVPCDCMSHRYSCLLWLLSHAGIGVARE